MTNHEEDLFQNLSNHRQKLSMSLKDPALKGISDIVTEKYSDQAHFVYELLQNADDAGATRAEFILTNDKLIFKHNGTRKFSISDVKDESTDTLRGTLGDINAITSIGNSNKDNVGNKIGKFGIGFKAVFRYTSTPKIFDGNFAFCINDFIVPELLDYEHPLRGEDETLFEFPFNSAYIAADKAFYDIARKLRGLDCPILFLSHLKEVYFYINDAHEELYEKEIIETKIFDDITAELVNMHQPSNSLRLWLFSRNYNGKNYSVGFFINEKNKLSPVEKSAFCFFPTTRDTKLNFIIHAPFLLTASREGILTGEVHNETLIKLLAELAADSLLYLRDIKLIDDGILDIVPLNESDFNVNDQISFKPFYAAIKIKMQSEKLLPTRTGYVYRKNAYWADTINLTEIFSDEQLAAIIANPDAAWVFTSTSDKNAQKAVYIRDIVRDTLNESALLKGRRDFYSQLNNRIIQGITEKFIESQPFEWFQKFYEWISETSSRISVAKTAPFFLDTNGKAVRAYDGDKLILFLPNGGDYTTIHHELISNESIKNFLIEKIGLKEPSPKDEIYTKILPRYESNNLTDESYCFQKIFSYYKQCPQTGITDYLKKLKTVMTFRTLDRKYCKSNKMYFYSQDLENYFTAANVNAHFIDEKFYLNWLDKSDKLTLHEFFTRLGVVSEVCYIEKEIYESDAHDYDILGFYLPSPHTKNGTERIWRENVIESAEELLNVIVNDKDAEKSVLLWERLVAVNQNVDKLKNNIYGHCHFSWHGEKNEAYTPTIFVQKFLKEAWLVDKHGNFKKPSEITVDKMAHDYDVTSKSALEVIDFLGINEDNRLTDEEKKLIAQAKKLADAGFTDAEIDKLIAEKNKSKTSTPIQTNEKLSAKKIQSHETFPVDTPKNIPDTQNFSEETEVDSDDLTPALVDYEKKLERAKNKSDTEQKDLEQLEELQNIAKSSEKYSFGWFKAILELEILNSLEKNSSSKEISITFSRVEFDADSNRTLILKYPSRYIPQFIEELENIPLVLNTAATSTKFVIEVAAVKNYTLRVKLKDNSKLEGINLADVKEATVSAKNPVFLLEELKKQFDALNFDDGFNLRENLCENIDFVFGPPGTGKTYNIAGKIIDFMKNPGAKKILVLTPTNKAADVIVKQIVERSSNDDYKNWLLRFGTTDDDNIEKSGIFRDKTFDINAVKQNVTVTTIARFPYDFFMKDDKRIYLRGINWDYIIIDEASMIQLAQILLPLYLKTPKKFIIAGDPFQIEPVTAVDLWRNENIYTLVELKSFVNPQTTPHNYHVEPLTKQYRSVPAIGKIFSNFAYNGILEHKRADVDRRPLNIDNWLDVKTLNIIKFPVSKYESIYRARYLNGTSSYQIYSALFTFEFVKALSFQIEKNNPGEKFSIGIIAPYRAQADLIEKLFMSKKHSDFVEVQVGTIHTFQGDECNILFTVFNPPPTISASKEMFLNRLNIINVAISRARDYLFMLMPDDDTDRIENLKLVKQIENLFAKEMNSGEFAAHDIERLIFGVENYIENNSFATGHQNVNVYGKLEKKYEIRSGDSAVDIQLHE